MVLVETHIPRSARILLVCLLVSVACMPRAVGQECEYESFLDAIPGDIFGDTSIFKTAIKISGYQVRLPQFRGTRFEDTLCTRSLQRQVWALTFCRHVLEDIPYILAERMDLFYASRLFNAFLGVERQIDIMLPVTNLSFLFLGAGQIAQPKVRCFNHATCSYKRSMAENALG